VSSDAPRHRTNAPHAARAGGLLAPVEPEGVLNIDLAVQREAGTLGAWLWRLEPGQVWPQRATRHVREAELHEAVDTRAMADEQLTDLYPARPRALPPEVQHLPPEARGGATEVTPR
jgi:hypothetical protein